MLTLVIDTSSAAVTAGIVDIGPDGPDGPDVLAERVTVDARAHGELLAPQIASALAAGGIAAADLRSVVAGVGPGPFTGLRVGLVTAAMIGELLEIPTYGVCSLDAIALAASASASVSAAASVGGRRPIALLVAGDARRREVYWARYLDGVRLAGPDVHRPAELPQAPEAHPAGAGAYMAGAGAYMAGAGARLYADVLREALIDVDYPPVAALAEAAADRIRAGAPSERLTPLYLRRPDAVAPTDYKAVTPS